MNIILSLDDNFVDYTKTTMASILITTKTPIDFYLLTNSKEINLKNFESLKKIKDCNIKLVTIPEIYYSFLKDRKIFSHLTVATYFRHFAYKVLPKKVNKAIYIDSDTLVLRDLTELYNYKIYSDEYVLGVEDAASKKKKDIWGLDRYINAGVLLMNLDFQRNFDELFMFKLKEFYQLYGDKTISGDQDMLNMVFTPRYIPIKFNLYHPFFNKSFEPSSCSMKDYYEYCKNPYIIHFVGGNNKPWLPTCVHKYKQRWLETYSLIKNI